LLGSSTVPSLLHLLARLVGAQLRVHRGGQAIAIDERSICAAGE
jgi:hypothetical protein